MARLFMRLPWLEQPVCQRSTGYSEPKKRRAGERGSSKSRIRPLPDWPSPIEGEKVARRPSGQIVNRFCQTTSVSGPSWPLAFQSGQEANSPSLFGAGEDAGSTSANPDPPSANWRTKTPKTCHFLGDFDPFRHISCLAEGGLACRICYTGHAFWPSANELPWQKGVLTPDL
jgi:hypothetical protein